MVTVMTSRKTFIIDENTAVIVAALFVTGQIADHNEGPLSAIDQLDYFLEKLEQESTLVRVRRDSRG